jgi:RNA polymerase sigma-70 factor (ECF subfamily)
MSKESAERSRGHLRLVPDAVPPAPPLPRAPKPSERPPARVDSTLDDSQLLAAMKSGDASVAKAFHDRVRPQVDRTICRLLGRRDTDHDDLAQLALIELVTTIDRYRGDCSLDGWTSTISAHVVYKHIRRRQLERRTFSAVAIEDIIVSSPKYAGRDPLVRDVLARIMQHLDAMDETRAWAYVLHDVCGHDLREIAEITGVSVAAAQTRLVRGRRELHDRMAADPELALRMAGMEGPP